VIGSASVGLYAPAVAQALAVACTYIDTDSERLSLAEGFGAKVMQAPAQGQAFGSFPVTAACTSSSGGLMSALASTEPGGICQSAGIHFQKVDFPIFESYRKGVQFHIGRANASRDIPAILALIAAGKLAPEKVTSQVFAIDDALDALRGPLKTKTILSLGLR
jgi:threonine dehydrogenase-like Zn-dependent dehydrogenase